MKTAATAPSRFDVPFVGASVTRPARATALGQASVYAATDDLEMQPMGQSVALGVQPPAYTSDAAQVRATKSGVGTKKFVFGLAAAAVGGILLGVGTGFAARGPQLHRAAASLAASEQNAASLTTQLAAAQPIYAQLAPQTPVRVYNRVYGTNYADTLAGRQALIADHAVDHNASLPVLAFSDLAQIYLSDEDFMPLTNTTCSIPNLFLTTDAGFANGDMKLLAFERPLVGSIGALNSIGPSDKNTSTIYNAPQINVTQTRGPIDLSILDSLIAVNGLSSLYGPLTSEITVLLDTRPVDVTKALFLASPKVNGVHTGFLMAVDDASLEYNRPIIQVGGTTVGKGLLCGSAADYTYALLPQEAPALHRRKTDP